MTARPPSPGSTCEYAFLTGYDSLGVNKLVAAAILADDPDFGWTLYSGDPFLTPVFVAGPQNSADLQRCKALSGRFPSQVNGKTQTCNAFGHGQLAVPN